MFPKLRALSTEPLKSHLFRFAGLQRGGGGTAVVIPGRVLRNSADEKGLDGFREFRPRSRRVRQSAAARRNRRSQSPARGTVRNAARKKQKGLQVGEE